MHWLVERAASRINIHQFGHDEKTAYRRAHQRDAPPSQFEFGEQVMARYAPKRAKSGRTSPLAPRPTLGTWVGVHEATIEIIVALQPGRVARVRAAFRRFEGERWNGQQVFGTRATPLSPNPGSPGKLIPALRIEDGDSHRSGKHFPDTPVN